MICISNGLTSPAQASRRKMLQAGIGMAAGLVGAKTMAAATADNAHFPFGPVLPARAIPAWPVVTDQARTDDLTSLLRGRVSAVQLMFTGCSATCPIQGALFAQAQMQWRQSRGDDAQTRFLSISIDPLSDTPAALNSWLRKFGALPGWTAVVPRPADLDAIFDLLGRGGENKPKGSDPHTGQVYLVNRRGELVYRTVSMPPASQIVSLLRQISERSI